MKTRIEYIDAIRGFAIILVVIGHLIQLNYTDAFQDKIFNVIYSFHMPLFFFISGCVASSIPKEKKSLMLRQGSKMIINKAFALLLPSVIWSVLVPMFFEEFTFNGEVSKFWFLNTLFAVFVMWYILQIVTIITGNRIGKLLLCLAFIGLISLFIFDVSRFTIMYFTMFVVGYVVRKQNIMVKISNFSIAFFALAFLLFVGFFKYGETAAGEPGRIFMEIPLSILASIVLLYVFSKYNSDNAIFKGLSTIGKYTLGIYVCHFYFLNLPCLGTLQTGLSTPFQVVVLCLVAIFICYVCILIEKTIQPITWLYKTMYGKVKL